MLSYFKIIDNVKVLICKYLPKLYYFIEALYIKTNRLASRPRHMANVNKC